MSAQEPRHALPAHSTPQIASWLTPQVRQWLYGIVTALVPLLTLYGVIDDTAAPLWAAVAASVLSTSTALIHTPKGEGL